MNHDKDVQALNAFTGTRFPKIFSLEAIDGSAALGATDGEIIAWCTPANTVGYEELTAVSDLLARHRSTVSIHLSELCIKALGGIKSPLQGRLVFTPGEQMRVKLWVSGCDIVSDSIFCPTAPPVPHELEEEGDHYYCVQRLAKAAKFVARRGEGVMLHLPSFLKEPVLITASQSNRFAYVAARRS